MDVALAARKAICKARFEPFLGGTKVAIPPVQRAQVFVGSSSEGLAVAQEVVRGLRAVAVVRLWKDEDLFPLGSMTLPRLIAVAAQVDFAVLVLTADDLVRKRGKQVLSPRDNVIFEAGLFTGSAGAERTFLVHSKDLERALPSDLAGLTTAGYPEGEELRASLAPALRKIRNRIGRLGRRGVVTLELGVEVPPETDPGLRVAVAGTLDKLAQRMPLWEPGIELRRRRRNRWSIELSGPEGTGIEYKYMLGPPWDWSHAETRMNGNFRENRRLVFEPGQQEQFDIVEGWQA